MSSDPSGRYGGDKTVLETWEALAGDAGATLVDVRTQAEWSYVGLPSLEALGKSPLLVEWQRFPTMELSGDFVERLSAELAARGVGRDAPIYFLCRSGARSRSAAMAMTAAGFEQCFNVADGFEGPRDGDGHRGTQAGWKAAGLPWVQS